MFRNLEEVKIEPTQIVYKPHCNNCGFLIDSKVEYQDIYESIGRTSNGTTIAKRKAGANIYPNKCKACGAWFYSIEMTLPEKLPDTDI